MKGTNIENDEYVIDLTAHQFDEIISPFLLIEKSKYPLSKVFSLDISEIIDFQNWGGLDPFKPKIQSIFYVDYYK
ncbi:hypothetical protein J683_2813 [Acinetobacter baumannii 1007214]|nr:hypothetical protein J561_2493 [Acinetobacter baumannii 50595]EXH95101.1 hypothetical protein J609_1652 [Acinetobacter baumannii 3390]EXQ81287.1 hypothetical protein J683_2813 [Acinetobacter baumannii 1007214]KCY35511.1 hypothetical protein J726_2271 [Acinetobacter baumannii 1262761-105]